MKNSAYQNSKIKHQLREKKERNVKELIWKLNPEQILFIENLGYRVEPYLYEVRTKKLDNLQLCNSKLLKEIHYKYKKGIKTAIFKLNHSTVLLLDDY